MARGKDERKVNEGERESTNKVRDQAYKEKMQRKRKKNNTGGGGGIRAKRGGGSGREGAERKRDKGMSKKDKRQGEQVRGGGIRAGDVTFRLSRVCCECMCGAQSGLKASSTPLNLHSQNSFFIPLITWLSSDQSAAFPA